MFIRKNLLEILVVIFSLLFSFWLMFHTFSYRNGEMLIAAKAWSDFASHIPLIRSFSLGDNFPPEYPLFSGEPIRYHFLFYYFVGLIEKTGVSIDYALNIPSALSFAGLILIIYFFAKTLFKSRTVGILSVVFFLFNGSLSFLEFFKTHPLSLNIVSDIITNNTFPSFGPYDGKIVSAFWNLNIYTNQRHLALPMALLFFVLFLIILQELKQKKISRVWSLIFGILIGILPLSHSSLFIMAVAVLSIIFILLPKQRLPVLTILIIAGLISLPRIIFLKQTAIFIPQLKIGYLIGNNFSFENFMSYWVANIGLFFFLIPLGFIFSSKLQRKILLAFLSLFLIGNFMQFSPEIASNHKFFNVFLIVGNMFAAFLIMQVWNKRLIQKAIIVLVFPFLILSGVIDFFPIKNDNKMSIADYPKNPDVAWIMNNTPKDAVFLNSSYLYHPASLAGRKIFLGWPYFPWSLGHDTNGREELRKNLLATSEFKYFCDEIKRHNISYVAIDSLENMVINSKFFLEKLTKIYENEKTGLIIFNAIDKCSY